MQFKDIENKLFIYHKANNRPFYRILLVIGILVLPMIFLFLPLPGYWALSVPVFDVRFICSILFFYLIIAGLLKFHAAVFQKRYFFWAIDTFGVSKFRFLYCSSRIKFCAPVFLLLLAGFMQANVAVHTIFRLILVRNEGLNGNASQYLLLLRGDGKLYYTVLPKTNGIQRKQEGEAEKVHVQVRA